jgi:hypothetical protein
LKNVKETTPISFREGLCWLALFGWFVFFLGLFARNLPDNALRRAMEPFDREVLTKLGMYHRGWGMFPGPGTGTFIVQARWIWFDGSSQVVQYFPLRSSARRSVWNEVMEDLAIRDDNNDTGGAIITGYFRYQCKHSKSSNPAAGPLKQIQFDLM